MSANSTYGLKTKIGSSVPFFHKKNNSYNFSLNTGRLNQISKKYSKDKKQLKNYQTNNSKFNIVNHSNYIKKDSNISKLLTSINKNNKKIELNFNKYYSPTYRLNKSNLENIILLKKRQYPSQTNINKKMLNKESYIKDYNINNNKVKSVNNSKKLSNINININISKKIISTYYNKAKNKNNIIIKKKSVNALNNTEIKENENKKYYKINNKDNSNQNDTENIVKNQSEIILKKFSNKDINLIGNQSKNSMNHNSLGHFSTNSNMSTNTNKNNHCSKTNLNNIKNNNYINYTSNDIYNNNNISKDKENNKKNQGNIYNKIIKENKSMYLSKIEIPINSSFSPRNINNIQNYLKYLHIGQNKNKNSPNNKGKNPKFSSNNLNFTHNNTEYNVNNKTGIYDSNNAFTKINYKYNKKNINDIPKNENKKENNKNENNMILNAKKKKSNQICNKSTSIDENKGIDIISIENPEELHYFYVKLVQKGKNINFDNKKNESEY